MGETVLIPFVKVINTGKNTYAYDVNTGHIVKVHPIMGEVLQNYGYYSRNTCDDTYGKIMNAIKEYQTKEGIFLSNRPGEILPGLTFADIADDDCRICTHIILCLTESCNLNCRYCLYSGLYPERRRHSEKTMSWETARKAIDILVSSAAKTDDDLYLGFYGGEPLLRFDLIKKAVLYTEEKLGARPYFSITTNGLLLNEEIIEFFIARRFIITISLDGPEQIHDRNRVQQNGMGSFTQVQRALENLRCMAGEDYFRKFVTFSSVLTAPYDLESLHRFFREYPVVVRVSAPDFHPDLNHELRMKKPQGFEKMAELLEDYCLSRKKDSDFRADGLAFPFDLFSRELKKIHRRTFRSEAPSRVSVLGLCQPGYKRAFVSCDGSVYVCERVEGNENMLIGTVDTGVEREKVRQILEDAGKLDFSECRDCWLQHMCRPCFAQLVQNSNYSSEKWRFICDNLRRNFEFVLRLYCRINEQDETAIEYFLQAKTGIAGMEE